MPGKTPKQRKAAGAELSRRRAGVGKSKARPFGTAKIEDLRDFARKPKKSPRKSGRNR